MRILVTCALLMLLASSAYAGGYSSLAVPTGLDIDRGSGFMFYGDFGNAGSCTTNNSIYVKVGHPQYKEIYSTVLAAFSTGKKIQAYIHSCEPIGWYSGPSTTYNVVDSAAAVYIRN